MGRLFLWLLCRPCKIHTLISQPSAPPHKLVVGRRQRHPERPTLVTLLFHACAVTFIFDLHREPVFLASPILGIEVTANYQEQVGPFRYLFALKLTLLTWAFPDFGLFYHRPLPVIPLARKPLLLPNRSRGHYIFNPGSNELV